MILKLKSVCSMTFKKPKLLLITTIASVAFFIGLFMLAFQDYAAKAKILVVDKDIGAETSEGKPSSNALHTAAELFKSRYLMEEVVKELHLEDAFGNIDPADKLLSMVDAKTAKDTNILEITVRSKKPELAAQVANTLCKIVVVGATKKHFSFKKDLLSWLSQESANMRKGLEDSTDRLREFKESGGTADLATEYNNAKAQVEKLQNELAAVQSERQQAKAMYSTVRKDLDAGKTQSEILYVRQDEGYKKMQEEYAVLEKKKNDLLSVYQPSHPNVAETSDLLSALETRMPIRAGEIINDIELRYHALETKEKEAQEIFKEENERLLRLEKRLDEYNLFLDDLKENEAMYNAFLSKVEGGGFEAGVIVQQIELLEQAYLPQKKARPPLFLAVLIGLITGLIIAVLYNITRDEKISPSEKAGAPKSKTKGMYIERVREDVQAQ